MKMKQLIATALLLFGLLGAAFSAEMTTSEGAESLGWRLGTQAYTFNRYTFFEAVDKAASMGLKYIEAYPGQTLSADQDVKIGPGMNAEQRKIMLDKVKSVGMKLVNFGVTGAGDEKGWRELFTFAKEMGIETIVSEPDPKDLDLIEKLCDEFKVNLAFHNHPQPSRYWNPDTVLEAVKGRTWRMGACADTGHWVRSGLDPLECIKKLEGRIISMHFKDLHEKSDKGHDVPWGTGVCNVYGLLSELKRQYFRGTFAIEYEHNWTTSVPEIRQGVEYFNLISLGLDELGYAVAGEAILDECDYKPGSWVIEGETLVAKGGGDLWSRQRFGDFAFALEFQCDANTNSGVFIRCDDTEQWLHTGIEVQIQQPIAENTRHNSGGLFDVSSPAKNNLKPAGEWNTMLIIAKGPRIIVIQNGEQVTDVNLDNWTEAHKNPDGSKNKFNNAYKDMAREGFIGLQYHGHPIAFRNVALKPFE